MIGIHSQQFWLAFPGVSFFFSFFILCEVYQIWDIMDSQPESVNSGTSHYELDLRWACTLMGSILQGK